MKLLGIARSPRFSPNSVRRDAAILEAVADELCRKGHKVERIGEDALAAARVPDRLRHDYDAVFSMGRSRTLLECLAAGERDGLTVINSARALQRATRSALTQLFVANGLPVPRTCRLGAAKCDLPFPLWLKRGDACAQTATDVCRAADEEELAAARKAFAERGIADLLACEHIAGDLIKFYGVEGTDFFYTAYATAGATFSKFGLERFNGAPAGHAFCREALKRCADRAARLSGIAVYGGDCVVRPDGTFVIIDFNDWPSFSPCCATAAVAIAQRILTIKDELYDR